MTSKRKAASGSTAAAVGESDAHSTKRRKLENSSEETPETTSKVGLGFLEQLKATRDKRNHLIATHFLELPDKKKIPQYYEEIGLPMSLTIIEERLNRREYPTLTPVESDLRRMVGNAKSFNEKSSEIFSDAEKIRKILVAFMTQNNPAYKSRSYVPAPTPIPDGWQDRLEAEQEEPRGADNGSGTDHEASMKEDQDQLTRPTITARSSSANVTDSRRATSTPAVQDAQGAGESFEGDTFQQAQEKIMTELINLKNDEGLLISGPFINLPSRELRDYYRLIKHPVCLKSVQKAVKGVKGREKPTGHTLLKSWQAFEDENSYIWNNAREYNEDGSDISETAGMLESYFNRRLAEAKRVVQEPPQPKVKLRMPAKSPEPPKITLRFGGQKQGSSGVSVDSESLKRQQDLVNAGANGRAPPSGSAPPMRPLGSQESNRSGSTEHAAVNGVKRELPTSQSPSLAAVQPNGDVTRSVETRQSPSAALSAMPPPSGFTPRLASGSPHPQNVGLSAHASTHASSTAFDARRRQPGKDASDALISNLTVSTHPGLKLEQHFHWEIPPSPASTHQSATINLPSTHFFLRLCPTLASGLTQRASKVFVTAGMQRLNPVPQRPEEIDPRKPLYETRIVPGVNRIEIEVVAGPTRGTPKVGSGPDVEIEKIILFANLAK